MDQYELERQVKRTPDINLLKMIESRIMEIVQIENDCKKKLPKLFNQRLPRFMRRRAACHDTSRLPKRLRALLGTPTSDTPANKKAKTKLLKYKRKMLFRKRKRKLRKHHDPLLANQTKSLLHKWFAKRFKMDSDYVPVHNNTKNQRNLKRQLRYGCAYFSYAHMNSLEICVSDASKNLKLVRETLNQLTYSISGFTFCAQALDEKRYEVCVHLYEPLVSGEERQTRDYICPALVSLRAADDVKDAKFCIWCDRVHLERVSQLLDSTLSDLKEKNLVSITKALPQHVMRIKLVGQNAYEESARIVADKSQHKAALEDTERRLPRRLGAAIGRFRAENLYTDYIYYNTYPSSVDIVFKNREGKLIWHKMIKNKAHIVGGRRDVERLLSEGCFRLQPDV